MTFKFDARKYFSGGTKLFSGKSPSKWSLAAVLCAGITAASSGVAWAQVYFRPYAYEQPYYYRGPDFDRERDYERAPARPRAAPYASRREIAAILDDEGFRLVGPLDIRENLIVAIGVDDQGGRTRFLIDPEDGELIGARRLDQQQASREQMREEYPRDEELAAPRPRVWGPEPPLGSATPTPRKERALESETPSGPARKARQSASRDVSPAPRAPSPAAATRANPKEPTWPEGARAPAAAAAPRLAPHPAKPAVKAAAHVVDPKPPQVIAPVAPQVAPPVTPAKAAAGPPAAKPTPAFVHGSGHRAIVPPLDAAQTKTTTPTAPAAPTTPPAQLVGSPGAAAKPTTGAPAETSAKPTGG